jgi:uncharacterized membrane protein YdjX (TVP38/TMEM64 family)
MPRALRILGALAVLALPLALTQLPPVRAALIAIVTQMQGGTPAGVAMFVGAYAVGAIFTAPVALFAGMAGYAYGPVRGLLLASPASVVAATVAFLVGRNLLAGPLGRRIAASPRWSSIHRAVSADAFRIALLLRVTPIAPQNFLSYGLSLTPMRVGTFMAATWLGLLPVTCFQVYVGSLVRDVADLIDGKRPPLGPWSWVAPAAGLAVTLAAVVILARMGRRALARQGV